MKVPLYRFFHVVGPFASAISLISISAVLVLTIVLTDIKTQWVTFLAGILVAAILAEATRVSHAEWSLLRRTAQLKQVRDRLEEEMRLRKKAEAHSAASKPRLDLLDDVLPTMVVFVDNAGICRYHNRAFMDGLRKPPTQIIEHSLRNVVGAKTYQEIAAECRQALEGHYVRYEQTHMRSDGAIYRLSVEHIPQFSDDGQVAGFFMVMSDITSHDDVAQGKQGSLSHPALGSKRTARDSQSLYVETLSEQLNGDKDAELIMTAIERGDFHLFCQLITPLQTDGTGHYEILVRLAEEEESLIPPGAFFPLAEKYGMMTHLDRWVVQHVIAWVAQQQRDAAYGRQTLYFINLARATMDDASFVDYLHAALSQHGVSPAVLCFEIPGLELALRPESVTSFARRIRDNGSRIAVSGFGRDRILFDLLRGFQVDFLKIDGGIIFDILRDPVELAKLTAIQSVAVKLGIATIAELVEDEATLAKLRGIGIAYAQGFGISRPRPLAA